MTAKGEEESARATDECFIKDADTDDVYIDLDSFWRDMGGLPHDPPQGTLEDFSFLNIPEGLQEVLSPGAEVQRTSALSPSYNSEVSDCRTGCSDGFSESAGNSFGPDEKLEPSAHLNFAEHGYSQNVIDHVPDQGNDLCFIQSGASEIHYPNCEDDQFRYSRMDASSNNLYREKIMEDTDSRTSFLQMEGSSIFNGDKTSHDASCTESSSYDVSGAEITDPLPENSSQYVLNSHELPFPPHCPVFTSFDSDYHWIDDIMDDRKKHDENFNVIPYKLLVGNEVGHHKANNGNDTSTILNRVVDMHAMRIQPKGPSPNTLFNLCGKVQSHIDVENNYESITSKDIVSRASGVIGDVISRNYHLGFGESTATEGIAWSSSKSSSLISHKNYISPVKDEEGIFLDSDRTLLSLGMIGDIAIKTSSIHDSSSVLGLSGEPGKLPSPSIKAEVNCIKTENEVQKFNGFGLSNITYKGIPSNTFEHTNTDEDSDVQIIEDLSKHARTISTATNAKLIAESHFSSSRTPAGQLVTGHSRIKANDERVIYRVALQDLSQPKSEATPPEGLLAVPLLKHQRIALFWMVNKETKSACCSGGILADDQGLGKTVSTIALILKERSPSSEVIKAIKEQIKTETLNLDWEDGEAPETYYVKERAEPYQSNDFHMYGGKACLRAKGRPAAGTLIVCPTSVLRQWSDELHNKVTSKANLSILVYHGSNRTKDPLELAKYDVVVTTYAIVSMEVPKQPNVNELDDSLGEPHQGLSSSKKRKLLGTLSDKKSSKNKKNKNGDDNELLETISGPLAKVGWFRVVLDEAQSIKNHRTQAARACWGLRAKRRWCLSGTPIQNTIDDLYSYFRFLRHEPYAVFKTFCDQIKVPIHRNPKKGFKKLQAVLKTIMLRRTKGTLLDGEPIINLPPKSIELRQVNFSKVELDFYRTLEADSRAQFAEYAANGTVEQNYVNILLMLLRLRQACDHPLLVKQCNSYSKTNFSIAMAKKLPRDRQVFLLNCLEASLAICGICSDPPEDASVTVCGHVFCNQCICEHMLGDDPQCPAENCKRHLNTSHVFSITSLRNALSDHPSLEGTTQCNGSEFAKVSEPDFPCYPQESSKIKAALKILLSLSKPHDCTSKMSTSESIREGYSSEKLLLCDSGGENVNENRNPTNAVPAAGEKAIVFSQWTKMLDLLEASLKNTSIQYRRLDGTMAVTARDKAVKDFNSLPQVSVIIMSLKAASLGLNMVAACHVILLDLWWNPTTEDQAIDRAHRIGQTRPVSVFRLTVKDTVEDRILALQQRKRQMVASAFGEDETGSRETRLTVDDLKYLFMAN